MSGALVKNRNGYGNRSETDSPELGDPSPHLSTEEAIVWREFQEEVPWLKECHRALIEIASTIRSDIRRGLSTAGDKRLLLSILNAIGATPAMSGRIQKSKPDEEEDEFD
jgi:hypothetical protein